ncbi:hypothetical protein B0H66DRAFT_543545 [Apodospora peruviana]|uniref:Uncharacterized protein n=1 Tax=Apodospora peruviana TaxID=516989 RepID=A0AAE0MFH5_9PEZI|nr:hypothetical protein B0H66DRAFT_543545 [Apodospora peruviana]
MMLNSLPQTSASLILLTCPGVNTNIGHRAYMALIYCPNGYIYDTGSVMVTFPTVLSVSCNPAPPHPSSNVQLSRCNSHLVAVPGRLHWENIYGHSHGRSEGNPVKVRVCSARC